MIKVSVFYPNEEGKKFDMDYYLNSHIPMVQEKVGAALKGGAVEQGLSGHRARFPSNLCCHGLSIIRFSGGVSERLRASLGSDYGRYSQLHRHPAHVSNQ